MICVAVVSCQTRPVLWVVPVSTVDNLTLGVSEREGSNTPVAVEAIYVYGSQILGSNDPPVHPIWVAVRNEKEVVTKTSRIRYGETIPGLRVLVEAEPLKDYIDFKAHVYLRDSRNEMRTAVLWCLNSESGRVTEKWK